MSQERTEQFAFNPEKVRQLLVELVKDSLIHGLPISSQKYVLSDLAEAHEEIERMDIVIAEQADYIDAINKASDGLDTAVYLHMCHIDQLQKDLVWEKAFSDEYGAEMNRLESELRIEKSKNSDLTAKVQERDREIQRSREIIIDTDEQVNEQAEEITRLRDALRDANQRFDLIHKSGFMTIMRGQALVGRDLSAAALGEGEEQ